MEHGTRPGRPRTYVAQSAVVAGPDALDQLGPELDELMEAAGAPVTARGTWLRTWVGAYRPPAPWAVTVRDGSTGRLDGVALLSSRRVDGHEAVSPLGRRQSDRGTLPVRRPEAAGALAGALVTALVRRRGPWALRLGQLPVGDPVVAEVVRRLGSARTAPGLPIPAVEFKDAETIDQWLASGLRKQLRKARNRLVADRVTASMAVAGRPDEVIPLLADVERTHRARERDACRDSELETTPGRRFWRGTVVEHARRGEAEVATLHLDGNLAAYVVSFLDGDTYRVFDGRFATAWARYSPGRLLESATLERALADPRFARVDWMTGFAPEKLVAANAVEPTEHLVASSPCLTVDLDVIGRSRATELDPAVAPAGPAR